MGSRAAWLLPVAMGCGGAAAVSGLGPPIVAPTVPAPGGSGAARRAGDAGAEIVIEADAAVMGAEGPFQSMAQYCDEYRQLHARTPEMAAGACGGGPPQCDPQPAMDPSPMAPWRSASLVSVGNVDLLGWFLAVETARGTFVVDLNLPAGRCDDSQSVGQKGGYSLTEEVHLSARVPGGRAPEIVVRSVVRSLAVHPLDPAYDNPDAADQLTSWEVVCRVQDGAPVCRTGCGASVDTR